MPDYFPEGDIPLPSDSYERLLQKAASLVSGRIGGAEAPLPSDSREVTMFKFVRGLRTAVGGVTTLDPDALNFAATSGAVDIVAIDQFVKGVKALGLWDDMVCWPLRSTQNAGTGTTAYSLGGLGTFNGTLVNGPTWGSDGILFDAASATHITTPLDVQNLRKFTTMVATEQRARVGFTNAIIAAWGATLPASYFIMRKTATNVLNGFVRNTEANRQTSATPASPDWRMYGWGTQGADTVATMSGALLTNDSTLNFTPDETASSNISIGIQTPPSTNPYDGTIAWAFFYKDEEMTTAQQLSLYNLYKTTLGTGLGLP